MKKAMLLWQAITPLHPGTGQDSANVIDLPVAREGGTNFPMIPASTIKGVFRDGEGLRDGDEDSRDPDVTKARSRFGFADRTTREGRSQSGVGDLSFTDARLLGLPVASFKGTYALVTCPLVLERLSRDRELLGFSPLTLPDEPGAGETPDDIAPELAGSPDQVPPPQAVVGTRTKLNHRGGVYLNDLDFMTRTDEAIDQLCAELLGTDEEPAQQLAQRLCLVGDDVFSFLCATALEVTAHIRLDPDSKTVEHGALWYEETLPTESLLTSFLMSSANDLSVLVGRRWLQMGGKSTVGRGLLKLSSVEEV